MTDSQAASLGEVQGVPHKSTLSIITQQKVLERKKARKRSEKSFSNTRKIVAFVDPKKFLILFLMIISVEFNKGNDGLEKQTKQSIESLF